MLAGPFCHQKRKAVPVNIRAASPATSRLINVGGQKKKKEKEKQGREEAPEPCHFMTEYGVGSEPRRRKEERARLVRGMTIDLNRVHRDARRI